MSNSATITFSQTGVQPPVYVVTSLSDPPWEILEMDVEKEQTASANLIFTRRFEGVAEGSYQYKIRIGDGHWVLDESTDCATDEHGNRNNVVHIKAASPATPLDSASDTATTDKQTAAEPILEKPTSPTLPRRDSTVDSDGSSQLPPMPIPFVVVEKVADQEQPEYGDTEPVSLPVDESKRAADAEPDVEVVKDDTSADNPSESPPLPQVVVEKTDDNPAYGDDFGKDASIAQKVAHDMRAADASPEKTVIKPESPKDTVPDVEEATPMSRHESFQSDERSPAPAMDTVDEVSVQSSTDQTSSGDIVNTPSDSQDDEESRTEPLLSHETAAVDHHTELGSGPLLSHEVGPEDKEYDELDNGPLLSHETGLKGNTGSSDEEYDGDELDAAPLLPHETGFSSYKGSEVTTDSRDEDEGYEARSFEPDLAPTFNRRHNLNNGDEYDEGYDDDVPLLPHERGDSAIADHSGSDEEIPFTLHGQPTFSYETDGEKQLFGGSGRPPVFRTRTNSSTLPHKLPRSDEEDENLLDPSLERFPTSRDQILERVATIGRHLPEDETTEDHIHSPVMSVLSQACSSVELAPVKSYTSLASVPEDDYSDENEMDDVASLPSPMMINTGRFPMGFARDPHATPKPDSGLAETTRDSNEETSQAHTTQTSEADSVGKSDGAKDSILSKLKDASATAKDVALPNTQPQSTEKSGTSSSEEQSAPPVEPQLRQRQVTKSNEPEPTSANDPNNANRPITPTPTKNLDKRNETFLQNFIRLVFGSVGRFFTACVGDRKRAG
ncbi:hypothetical protein FB567DRAFT_452479 [Paraphoma chrysanthemicola]|uniref:AMP-activated protein kinase glycogen-binding domain-containing protein n=1 Tax=Paraphoma chrysanthemicola TaxID=798071 RepID=A0A8K0VTZ2_9PLEO|nr:hypothetical protein FB567DRAFT_452479 [Paraphoma chrysanthemicola]